MKSKPYKIHTKALTKPPSVRLDPAKIANFEKRREVSFIPQTHKNFSENKFNNIDINDIEVVPSTIKNGTKRQDLEGTDIKNLKETNNGGQELKYFDIDQIIRERTKKSLKSIKDRYFKIEKLQDESFKQLQKRLVEPIQLSDIKRKKRKGKSIKPTVSKNVSNMLSKRGFNTGSKSPFRENNEKHMQKQVFKLGKLIDRMQLDRPILMREKMDVLWTKPTENLPEINIIRYQIEKKKYQRMKVNSRLRNIYTSLLDYIFTRYKANKDIGPTEIERKFIDILKTIIEGGYHIIEKDFYKIMDSVCFNLNDCFTKADYDFFMMFVKKIGFNVQQFDRWVRLKGYLFGS